MPIEPYVPPGPRPNPPGPFPTPRPKPAPEPAPNPQPNPQPTNPIPVPNPAPQPEPQPQPQPTNNPNITVGQALSALLRGTVGKVFKLDIQTVLLIGLTAFVGYNHFFKNSNPYVPTPAPIPNPAPNPIPNPTPNPIPNPSPSPLRPLVTDEQAEVWSNFFLGFVRVLKNDTGRAQVSGEGPALKTLQDFDEYQATATQVFQTSTGITGLHPANQIIENRVLQITKNKNPGQSLDENGLRNQLCELFRQIAIELNPKAANVPL